MARTVDVWRGPPLEVAARVRAAMASGELVEAQPLAAQYGRAVVRVVLDAPVASPAVASHGLAMRRRNLRPWLLALAVLAGVAIVAGIVLGVLWLVAWIVAHAVQIAGAAFILVLVAILAGTASSGGGTHCPGPWHR